MPCMGSITKLFNHNVLNKTIDFYVMCSSVCKGALCVMPFSFALSSCFQCFQSRHLYTNVFRISIFKMMVTSNFFFYYLFSFMSVCQVFAYSAEFFYIPMYIFYNVYIDTFIYIHKTIPRHGNKML